MKAGFNALANCLENLRVLQGGLAPLLEEELLWLSELARAQIEAAPSALPELPDELKAPPAEMEGESALSARMQEGRRLLLQIAYAACLSDARRALCGADYPFSLLLGNEDMAVLHRYVYVRTPQADRAYRHFSAGAPGATVAYVDSMEAACAEVYGERKDLAILPLADAEGEPVRKTLRLIEKYEMHVVAAVRLPVGAEGEELTYALLSRLPMALGAARQGGENLGLVFFPGQEREETAMLLAAESLGCRIGWAEFSRASYDRPFCRAVFSGEGITSLLLWLIFSERSYTVTGLYRTEAEGNMNRKENEA